MQNIYAPFNMSYHLIFCIISTIFYLYLYNRRGLKHHIYMIFAIDFTFITQFNPTKTVVFCLGIIEIELLILILTSVIAKSVKLKKAEKSAKLAHIEAG